MLSGWQALGQTVAGWPWSSLLGPVRDLSWENSQRLGYLTYSALSVEECSNLKFPFSPRGSELPINQGGQAGLAYVSNMADGVPALEAGLGAFSVLFQPEVFLILWASAFCGTSEVLPGELQTTPSSHEIVPSYGHLPQA